MGISTFPAATGGGAINNDFVVDMNDTTNNVIDLPRQFIAGSYGVTLGSGDTSYDIYFLDENGDSVGYTNTASIVATAGFSTVVILGVATDEIITFTFSGAVANANTEGDEPGAGAYLTSISPSDLPTADDTANVIGGNFSTAVEFYFESGTVSLPAKNIVRSNSTALVVTRPDALSAALDPWDVKVINPGVTPPTGSNAHILAGTVDAGAVPVFVTTSPLPNGTVSLAYAGTIVATDADGAVTYSVTAGSLPAGLSFNGATGVISGTPTGTAETFTVQALDDGGNSATREFTLPITLASGGSVVSDGGYTYHVFTTSSDFVAYTTLASVEYLVVAGGGGGGSTFSNFNTKGGGGGAGGLRNSFSGESSGSATSAESAISISAGTVAITVGAGGNADRSFSPNPAFSNSGGSSSIGTVVTTAGGGPGGTMSNTTTSGQAGSSGGSGGGATAQNTLFSGGAGTTAQGFSGGEANSGNAGSGGGALAAGVQSDNVGGAGLVTTAGTAVTNLNVFAKGGRAGPAGGGLGDNATNNSGSGGGGAGVNIYGNSSSSGGGNGGSGIVIVRYAS